jgi:hypothetical protein
MASSFYDKGARWESEWLSSEAIQIERRSAKRGDDSQGI